MNEQWYWKHKGELLGPLTIEDLDTLARKNRIADQDELRLAESDEWMTGRSFKSMLNGAAESSSAAASRVLAGAHRRPAPVAGHERGQSVDLLKPVQWAGERVGGVFSLGGDLVGSGVEQLFRLRSLLGNRWVLGAVAVVFVALILSRMELTAGRYLAIIDRYESIANQIDQASRMGTPSSTWDEMIQREEPWLSATIQDLDIAVRNSPIMQSTGMSSSRNAAVIRRDLLMAGRSLQSMLAAKGQTGTMKAEYRALWTSARQRLDRGLFAAPPPIQSGGGYSLNQGASASSFERWLTIGIVVVDVLIIAGVAIFLVRWRRRAAA